MLLLQLRQHSCIGNTGVRRNRNRTFYFTSSATSMAESTTPIVTAANVTSFMPIKSNIPKNNKNDENTEIQNDQLNDDKNKKDSIIKQLMAPNLENNSRPEHIPDIASLFVKRPLNTDSVFAGLGTHEIRSILQISEPKQKVVFTEHDEVQPSNNVITEASTIGPYDLIDQDYQADESDSTMLEQQQQDDDTSTVLPQSESSYKYNIKVRSNGKVLDPASK